MKASNLYALLASITYALLYCLGNYTSTEWEEQAAPWLGEEPEGLRTEGIRAGSMEEIPYTIFQLSANEEMKQKIIATLQLEECRPSRYENDGICAIYPEGKEKELRFSTIDYPWLEVAADGSMIFCPSDINLAEVKNDSRIRTLEVPYPQYLRSEGVEMARALMLAALCYLLPGVFCSVGWLWIQRKPLCDRDTKMVCFVIPAAVAFIGAFADFYIHGFHKSYALLGAGSAVFCNLLCAGVILGFTAVAKNLWGKPTCYR